MKTFYLDFKFKGDRKYIQGPDIYNKLMEYLYNEKIIFKNIDLSFHKIAKHNLRADFYNGINPVMENNNFVCVFKFANNENQPYSIYLFETDTAITEHQEYLEEKIVEASTVNITDKSISLFSATPYTNVEKIVALNKSLLNKLLTDPGKWYFTKLIVDTDINNETPNVVKLILVKNIGSKITKTLILFDEKEKGYLYFSKV